MTRHNWKYLMKLDDGATVYIDSTTKQTKIQKPTGYRYIYKGIFPNINFDTRKRFKK